MSALHEVIGEPPARSPEGLRCPITMDVEKALRRIARGAEGSRGAWSGAFQRALYPYQDPTSTWRASREPFRQGQVRAL